MNIGKVNKRNIVDEMQDAYLEYAMSVIMSRAIPDIRDGLKPVQRRILVTLNDLGLSAKSRFRKSAKICGDVSGNYHPHGEQIVYPALANLAQDFKMRYPLVDGQGNWGSIDGDAPAAARYTEARMTRISEEMLRDIEKNTVDFRPNYDNSRQEPVVLPTRVPQLLLNGTMGIAVGMATNIPPHNLGELISAIIYLIKYPKAETEDLMQFIKGPDFPTAGIIYNQKDLLEAYSTGRGGIVIRGKASLEKDSIIISEIPFQVNKSSLVEKIASLIRDKKLIGIKEVRDESDRDGLRLVIELKKDTAGQKIINKLYSLTDLQRRFNFNMLALVDGIQPKVLSLKEILGEFIKHRQDVIVRRSKYELKLAKDRLHILEGLDKALGHIDEIIDVIKKSKNKSEAGKKLIERFNFSEKQASSILEMRLQSLVGLERKKIKDELKERQELIKYLEGLLASSKKIHNKIAEELIEIKEKFGEQRRTRVVKSAVSEFNEEDLVPNEEAIITVTQGGYIKRVNPKIYRVQHRGGKGILGFSAKGDHIITHFFTANTHARLLFFTSLGRVFEIMAYEVPSASRTARGYALVNFLSLDSQEKVSAIIASENQIQFLAMVTKYGIIKKVKTESFANIRRSGLKAINLKKRDALKWVKPVSEGDEIILASSNGQAIRFKEQEVRSTGRTTRGVKGMNLRKNDEIISMGIIDGDELLVISENGYGKKTNLKEYKVQKRGGRGIKTLNVNDKTGLVVSGMVLSENDKELVVTSAKGQVIRIKTSSISKMGRATQGIRLMRLGAEDKVASITKV